MSAARDAGVTPSVAAIDGLLTQFERDGLPVGVYRRQYPEWWKPLVSFQAGWGQVLNPDNIVNQDHLDEIESFANFLEGKVFEFRAGGSEALRDLVASARTALENDTSLSPLLRAHIHRLLQQIEIALDDERIGATFDYGEAVQRLFVAFKAAESEETPSKGIWTSLWTQIVSGTASNVITQGATLVIGAISTVSSARSHSVSSSRVSLR